MPILINEVISEFAAPQTEQLPNNEKLSPSSADTADNTLRKMLEEQQLIVSRQQRLQVD